MTTYMNLTLPTVDITIGPTWASELNTAITAIDAHDHSSGKGVPIPVAGININANLDMNNYSLSSLGSATFVNLSNVLSTVNSLYVKSGDLYFTDAAGNAVRLTASGAINTGSVGGIGGDYVSAGASLYYTDSTKKYTFVDSAAALAPIEVGAITGTTLAVSGTSTLTGALTAATATISGAVTVSGTSTLSGATSFTGNTSGRGIVPVGGVLPLMSQLTGITNVTATTAADANGYVVCGGQTIVDATSPMNGAVIPNINNSVFLMGSSTAGSTGGSNTTTLAEANLPAHVHTIDHGHSNTFALANTTVPTSTHTHNIAHAHQWAYYETSGSYELRSRTTLDDSSTSIGGSDPTFLIDDRYSATGGSSALMSNLGNGTSLYTTGVLSPPSGSAGSTAASDTPSATQTVTLSGSVTSMTGNSGSTGSTTSYDSRPSYITAKYIMRIR